MVGGRWSVIGETPEPGRWPGTGHRHCCWPWRPLPPSSSCPSLASLPSGTEAAAASRSQYLSRRSSLRQAGLVQAHDGWGPGRGSSHCPLAIGALGWNTLKGKPSSAQGVPSRCCLGHYREPWAFPGKNLPSDPVGAPCHGCTLRLGTPRSPCWVSPAQVGSELGSEAPSGLGVQRTTSS